MVPSYQGQESEEEEEREGKKRKKERRKENSATSTLMKNTNKEVEASSKLNRDIIESQRIKKEEEESNPGI